MADLSVPHIIKITGMPSDKYKPEMKGRIGTGLLFLSTVIGFLLVPYATLLGAAVQFFVRKPLPLYCDLLLSGVSMLIVNLCVRRIPFVFPSSMLGWQSFVFGFLLSSGGVALGAAACWRLISRRHAEDEKA